MTKKIHSVNQVRDDFINFFQNQDHTFWKSSPVVPHNDPTLLFINAGMNQFKAVFLGNVDSTTQLGTLKRAVNSQKCIRAGGKHNDLDDVGKDVYHHTFFEMLGNWSFGDYFKKDAIFMAWTLLTEVWELPKDRLYVTYFGGDPKDPNIKPDIEARDQWLQYLSADRVLPFGMKDNFWEMGDTGPCGPCSEIHFDRIGNRDASALVNADDPNVVEIWNLVFIQFNRETSGSLTVLPKCSVDTGMGFERLVSVLLDLKSNYDTPCFAPIINQILKLCPDVPHPYTGLVGDEDTDGVDMAYRVLADHIRTLTVAIADGATPSNEGRGYVLRRILRRAVRYGQQVLKAPSKEPWFFNLVDCVVELLEGAYPEVRTNLSKVKMIIREEEVQFMKTLEKGTILFKKSIRDLKDGDTVSGKLAFELYSTYGFPLDLTVIMANERHLSVDEKGFRDAFAAHQEASESRKFKNKQLLLTPDSLSCLEKDRHVAATVDEAKYQWNTLGSGEDLGAQIKAIFNGTQFVESVSGESTQTADSDEASLSIVTDRTNFYAESGGQVGDTGNIVILRDDDEVQAMFRVEDTQKIGPYVLHVGYVSQGTFNVNDCVSMRVDFDRRTPIAKNHTATHLLNYALRKVLGNEVDQRGSIVDSNRLRFDFSFPRALQETEVQQVESIVQQAITGSLPVYKEEIAMSTAKQIQGLRAVFGETYPDPVRVVSVGAPIAQLLPSSGQTVDCSVEFCGGTHLTNAAEIQDFIIITEESISKGIRRIVALTGSEARESIRRGDEFWIRIQTADRQTNFNVMKAEINSAKIGYLQRQRCQAALVAAQQASIDLEKAQKKALKSLADAMGIAEAAKVGSRKAISYNLPELQGDFKAMESFVGYLVEQGVATLVLSPSKDSSSVSVLSIVPSNSSVAADQWVRSCVGENGKSGGKPKSARGTCPSAYLDDALLRADQFLSSSI